MTNNRVSNTKSVLWFLTGIATTVVIYRLIRGLGAATNLTDKNPWGLWIGFDVLSGVALAAGGFIICAVVYIFHAEKYHPLVRSAVLTAFLGYIAVAVGLFFDLGLPWRIWHPAVYWQHHSALFEVAWCVMLYLTVLLLEFSPVILEKIPFKPFQTLLKFLKRFTIVFVILGIMLSVLHQSSLGTLFMLMPVRLHPLWYSSIQPVLFFVSAVSLGLAMVTTESLGSSWLYKKHSERNILQDLAVAIPYVLFLYFVLRIGDLAYHHHLGLIFDGSWDSRLFIAEILVSTIIPGLLLATPRIRKNKYGLPFSALMVVLGFILHRIDTGIISSFQTTGSIYVPTFAEIATTVGIVSASGLAFLFFIEHFSVYPEPLAQQTEDLEPIDVISESGFSRAGLGEGRRYSFVYILGVALAIFFLPDNGLFNMLPQQVPVKPARLITVDSLRFTDGKNTVVGLNDQGPLFTANSLLFDGNHSAPAVLFNHERHIRDFGGKESCAKCHHMNLPLDRATSCYHCHRDMYRATDIFNHSEHIRLEGGNKGCSKCHTDSKLEKNRQTSVACLECHKSMRVRESLVETDENWKGFAAGYMQAMHGLCLRCHEKKEKEASKKFRTGISNCQTCHRENALKLLASAEPLLLNIENKKDGKQSH